MIAKSYDIQQVLKDVKKKEKEEKYIVKVINHILPTTLDYLNDVIVQNSIDTTDF